MNIRNWFGHKKTKVMDQVDRLIVGGLISEEQNDARREIAHQFDSLLDEMQNFADEMDKMKADIRRDNELIVMLCKGES